MAPVLLFPKHLKGLQIKEKTQHKMREKWHRQMALMTHVTNHPQCQELEAISAIIDSKPFPGSV